MKKTNFNWREAAERQSAIRARLSEMAEALENDKSRESFTEAEETERKALLRELDILEMKMRANMATIEVNGPADFEDANRKMRECIAAGQRFELRISREGSGSADPQANWNKTSANNPAPVQMGDIVEPLYNRLILSAIGSPLLTGLKGNYQWPVVEAFEASINGEGVALGDTKIPLSKLIAKPERIGIAVPVTREALNQTDDLIRMVCTQYMPVAVADLMNKIMFSQSVVSGATNLKGPFVTADMKSGNKKTYTGSAPSLAQIIELKGLVLKSNIQPEGLCYVMTETTKALLEATPKWSGANNPIVENDKILGVPVFTSSYVSEGDVLFGAFKYAPQGLFGDMVFIVDPYTLSRNNAIDFVLNVDYAITVLRYEAFAKLTKTQ